MVQNTSFYFSRRINGLRVILRFQGLTSSLGYRVCQDLSKYIKVWSRTMSR